jgi:branched-chain amino acid transport system ATP-binding protein
MVRTGLSDCAEVMAGSLPLLDRKRLELARALALRPKVLLLDEIAGGLTEMEVHGLVELIRAIKPEVAMVWIEHVTHALSAVADRVVAIHFGREIAAGSPAEVMSHPAVQEVYLGAVLDVPAVG